MKITKVLFIEPGLAKIWGESDERKIISQPWRYTVPRVSTTCANCNAFLEKGRLAYRAIGANGQDKLCVMCVEQSPLSDGGEGEAR